MRFIQVATVIPSAVAGALMIGPSLCRAIHDVAGVKALRFLGGYHSAFTCCTGHLLSECARRGQLPALFPFGQFGNIGTMAISIACALCAATVSYRFIELPSLKIGRSVPPLLQPAVRSRPRVIIGRLINTANGSSSEPFRSQPVGDLSGGCVLMRG